ncbi:MAG: zinc ribbon domain-containing protein [Pseudomonadota bacterium]|nr:zinc ribbon domain-containing protein [Pseudomonadota bacterium]
MNWVRFRTCRSLPEAHLVNTELMRGGVASEVRGESRAPLAGEIPFADARVEVWVVSEQLLLATTLLAEVDAAGEGPPHTCPKCGEENPPAFELCWRCGTDL